MTREQLPDELYLWPASVDLVWDAETDLREYISRLTASTPTVIAPGLAYHIHADFGWESPRAYVSPAGDIVCWEVGERDAETFKLFWHDGLPFYERIVDGSTTTWIGLAAAMTAIDGRRFGSLETGHSDASRERQAEYIIDAMHGDMRLAIWVHQLREYFAAKRGVPAP
jgi:hypothetical protein